jgi:hypothetical protein
MHVSAVLLPDRTVLATGGGRSENQDAVLPAEIYDPVANVWRTVASSSVPRFYHSTAVLLPDGRVVTMGSQPGDGSRETRIEIYSPPYLFKGSRPVITSNPATMSYGGSYSLQLSTAAKNIKYVSLMRPMATTHSTDTEQRLVDLPVSGTRSGSSLRVTVPTNQNLAPPGNYMLTVVDKNGIPSVAKWVHLG